MNPNPVQSDWSIRVFYCLETALLKQKDLTLARRFALPSLPLFEATVDSVLFGVWRAWQLTRYLAKALSLTSAVFHHTST